MNKLCMLFVVALMLISSAATAQERPFAKRFGATDNGDIRLIGNALLTCDAAQTVDCADARLGQAMTSRNNNNAHVMTNIDVDADSSTFNSSEASITLPNNVTVLWAGLYWGANVSRGTDGAAAPNEMIKDQVKFLVPGQSNYADLTASVCDSRSNDYQCFADVTALVPSGLDGTYRVANVQSGTGKGRYAGWGLVVVYQDASQPVRDLVVFDGYLYINANNNTVDVPISGFLTPPMGPVQTRVGVIGYEGDYNATGDSMRLDGQAISNMLNPTSNVFNSSNTAFDAHLTTNMPSYINQLGFDIDLIETNGVVANSATSATITLRTNGETYYPGVVTFATEIYAPRVEGIKTVTDDNGGDVEPGDLLTYTFSMENIGFDPAEQVVLTDDIPAGTTYVMGSLLVNGQAQSDAKDSDLAEIQGQTITARVGAMANAGMGGVLNLNDSATVSFKVRVDMMSQSGTQITNQGRIAYRSKTLGQDFESVTDSDAMIDGRTPTVIVVDQNPPTITIDQPADGGVTGDVRPTISGTTEPNATVDIALSNGQMGTVMADGNGNWTWQPISDLMAGAFVITATASDASGNQASAMSNFTVDLTPPNIAITQPAMGSTTNDATPTISGTSDPNVTVELRIDGGGVITVMADAMGNWSYTPPSDLSDGQHNVEARAVDAVGNAATTMTSFEVDTSAPTLTIDTPANGSSTTEKRPVISGKADPNAKVSLSLDGAQPVEITADAQGNWSYTPEQDLVEGEHSVVAEASDNGGNKANTSSTFTVDTTAPSVTISAPAKDSVVMTRRPAISGTSEPGADVTVSIDGTVIGTVRANEQGQWVISLDRDLDNGKYTVEAQASDAAGNSASTSHDFEVSVGPPAMVTITSPLDGATLNSNSPQTITGTATPNAMVTIEIDGKTFGTVTADAQGNWSYDPGILEDGEHTIVAKVPGASDSVTVTVDRTGPMLMITSPENNSTPASNPPTITGTGEPGQTVTIFVDGDRVGQTTVGDDGKWSFTPDDAIDPLDEGNIISARAEDIEGNTTQVDVKVNFGASGAVVVGGASCATTTPANHTPTSLLFVLMMIIGFGWRRRATYS